MESVGEFEYNTKDLIGHGAFAVVFKGRHKKSLTFTVAIKSITKKNLSKSQNLLVKEIKILKELTELHHENVVALLDCKETAHNVYLVMEYCNGGDLADYLHVKGTLSEDTIRLFLRQLAGAMKALNAKGVVHRDLKPQNILLCHGGSKPNPAPHEITLKIADFGFARFLQDGVMAATLCGSPMYMAPEVIMSLQYDAKADLWSIGTIVFQCLTGKAPFQAQTPQALKQFYEKNAHLSPKIPAGTSKELTELLLRMLQRNAKDRLEFDEFFSHPFLRMLAKPTSPVPVPSRQRSALSHESRIVSLSQQSLPPMDTEMNSVSGESATVGAGIGPTTPSNRAAEEPRASPLGATAAVHYGAASPRPGAGQGDRQGSFSYAESDRAMGECATTPQQEDDFVLVPNMPVDSSDDSRCSGGRKRSSDHHAVYYHGGRSNIPSNSPPMTGVGSSPDSYRLGMGSRAGTPVGSLGSVSPGSSRPSYLALGASPDTTQPIPVPTQKQAYQKMTQQASQTEPFNVQLRHRDNAGKENFNPLGSSKLNQDSLARYHPITQLSRQKGQPGLNNDIAGLSPPSVQFSLGTSPSGAPSSLPANNANMYRPGLANSPSPPPTNPQHWIMQQQGAVSPLRRASYQSQFQFVPNQAPFAMGSDVPQPPFVMPLNLRAQCGTELFPTRSDTPQLCMGGRGSTERQASVPAAGSSPFVPIVSSSPPSFQHSSSLGQIVFMQPPDLPEETLMEREHNETLAKLNFILALVDCIIELARSKATPIAQALSSSSNQNRNQGPGAALSPPYNPKTTRGGMRSGSEETLSLAGATDNRLKAEQLVLYVKALQMLASSLNLARDELKTARLRPSSSVKQAVNNLNDRYHVCLHMCKALHSQQGVLSAINQAKVDKAGEGSESGKQSPLQGGPLTADSLLYKHAIDMCQSAALDELFGSAQDCFHRYQTAQLLLHCLAQQTTNRQDRELLGKYKDAVEKRLFVLQQQGFVLAYENTTT